MTTFSKGILFSTSMFGAIQLIIFLLIIFLYDSSEVPSQKAINSVPQITQKGLQPTTSKQLSLQAQGDTLADENSIKINIALQQGETLFDALASANIAKKDIIAVSDSLKEVINLRKLMPGQKLGLSLEEGDDGNSVYKLKKLTLVADIDRLVIAERTGLHKFKTSYQEIEHSPELIFASGEITNNFFASAKAEGVATPILMDTFATLSHAIDFQRDINKGDSFVLGYEYFDDKEYGGKHPGKLMYVSMSLPEREISYFRHKTVDGYSGFFDAEGKSIDTSLLKTPVGGGSLSSLYGKRKHPVLSYARMHKGVDFSASIGTPIFAAGDGIVTARKKNGSFGKYIRIKHNNDYTTAYAHLSKYAKNIAVGSRVRQGDIIGYVGTTGLTSGPNLHYEVIYQGKQINPLTVQLPSRLILTGDEFERFERAKTILLSKYKPTSHPKYKMSQLSISGNTDGRS
jgi:murein DD-endopeptidase MepM/ murein hydrolase activator NlpD